MVLTEAGDVTIPDSNNSHAGEGAQHSHEHDPGKSVNSKARKLRLQGNFFQKEGVKVKVTTNKVKATTGTKE